MAGSSKVRYKFFRRSAFLGILHFIVTLLSYDNVVRVRLSNLIFSQANREYFLYTILKKDICGFNSKKLLLLCDALLI